MPAPSPLTEQSDLLSVAVKAGGAQIPDACELVRIEIVAEANRIPTATVTLRDGSAAGEDFLISDSGTFVPGQTLEIQAGYHGHTDTVFQGVVVKMRLQASAEEATSNLVVMAKDKAVKMTVGRRDATYVEQSDGDVIRELIERHELEADVESTGGQLEQLVQYYATDWDFMLTRAEANGWIVLVADGKVTVKSPEPEQEPVLSLTYGRDVYAFETETDARSQLGEIKASAWDAKTQELVEGSATTTDFYPLGNLETPELSKVTAPSDFDLQTSAAVSQERLEAWAKAAALKSEMAKVRGRIVFQGSSLPRPGLVVAVKGMGERFDGGAFVGGVRHVVSAGSWRTTVRTGLSPEWFASRPDVMAPAAAGLLPGVVGLVIGKVTSIVDDPDEEFRVKIKIPVLGAEGEVWARRSTFYATSGAGSFFYPEIDDEVVVGFLSGDPRSPVILGGLYSAGRKPALTPAEGNPKKAIVSDKQLKIELDDEHQVVTITTPKNNRVVLSDEGESITLSDQNDNSIKMSSDGIEIASASSITLKAETEIRATAESSVTIQGTESVHASGGGITLSADGELSASGEASASFSSSGELSINGSMVMIN